MLSKNEYNKAVAKALEYFKKPVFAYTRRNGKDRSC